MTNEPDISIIIATHNRADILRETLKNICLVDRSGINADFIIVDNNSNDRTCQVVAEFSDHLPLRNLFEAKQGQNPARNRALQQPNLGRIIAFTDDDISPRTDWLKAIVTATEKWPQYDVFGGKIYIIWPNAHIPKWAHNREIKSFAFAEHDYSDTPCSYQPILSKYPFSGNFWVRKHLFDNGRKFDEKIAWEPKNQILATETILLKQLSQQGHKFLHYPDAVVGHRISPGQLSLKYLVKRAYSAGRGTAHTEPMCRQKLLNKYPLAWSVLRIGAIARLSVDLAASMVPLTFKKPEKAMEAMRWIGYNVESLNIANNYKVH